MRRPPVLLVLVLVLGAACQQSDLTLSPDDGGGSAVQEAPAREDPATDPDETVQLALDDLAEYWGEQFPRVYDGPFEQLRGGYVPYGPNSPLPECGDVAIDYDDIAENALYCPAEDLIAWDRVRLIPSLQEQFGALTAGIVMAHEFAHAVQARAGVTGATVTVELQADCFAGAWVDDVEDRVPAFATDDDALDLALAGLLELRDQVGVAASDPQAHGSGFDRIIAFQEGYEQDLEVCTTYVDDPPPVVAIPFGSVTDLNQGGNLPLDRLVDPLLADLESFFTSLFADMGRSWDSVDELVAFDPAVDDVTCGDEAVPDDELELAAFYCARDDTIYIDAVGLVPALEEIGDFAFGGELARLHAVAAQSQLGVRPHDRAGLHADCLTGVYAAAEFGQEIPDQQLVLSPGDLDEIIVAFLAFGGETDVTAFERTAAFRSGFLDGVDRCDALLD